MKRLFGFALILCSLSVPAFAAKNSSNLTLLKTVKIGTAQVSPGDYKVSWTGSDSNLQLTFAKNGKTVATVPAKLVPAKNGAVSVETETVNGTEILQGVQLNKFNLEISNSTAAGN